MSQELRNVILKQQLFKYFAVIIVQTIPQHTLEPVLQLLHLGDRCQRLMNTEAGQHWYKIVLKSAHYT